MQTKRENRSPGGHRHHVRLDRLAVRGDKYLVRAYPLDWHPRQGPWADEVGSVFADASAQRVAVRSR